MPNQKTGPDTLGFYYTAPTRFAYQNSQTLSLGGYSSLNDVELWSAIIRGSLTPSPLGPIRIEVISGGDLHTRNQYGYIFATAEDTFAYQGPGETSPGTAQIVNAGEYGLLQSATDVDSFVRIKHEGTGTIPAFGKPMSLQLFSQFNNLLGQTNPTHAQRVAGRTTYRSFMLKNHGADAITNLKVWQASTNYSGTRIAKEAPVSNAIQIIASETAAPAGMSWNTGTTSGTGLDIGTLNAAEEYGVWIERVIAAAATAGAKFTITLNYSYTVSAVNYVGSWTGHFRMPNTGAVIYELFEGVDTTPNLATPVDTSATLPFTYPVTPGGGDTQHNFVVRYTDSYLLESQNTYYRSIKIDSAGVDVSDEIALSTLYDFSVTNTRGGKLLVMAKYPKLMDADVAEYFDIYEAGNATAVDASSNYILTTQAVSTTPDPHNPGAFDVLKREIGPFPFNADIQVALKTRKTSPTLESALTSIITTNVTTKLPQRIRNKVPFLSYAHAQDVDRFAAFTTDTDISVPNSIKWRQGSGYTTLMEGSNIIWKFIYNSEFTDWNGLWTTLAFEQAAISGTPSANPVEVQSWTGPSKILNLIAKDVRRLKIDYTGGFFSCAAIETGTGFLKTIVDIGPVKEMSWHTMIQVFDPFTNEFETVASLDDDGVLCLNGGLNVVASASDIP